MSQTHNPTSALLNTGCECTLRCTVCWDGGAKPSTDRMCVVAYYNSSSEADHGDIIAHPYLKGPESPSPDVDVIILDLFMMKRSIKTAL